MFHFFLEVFGDVWMNLDAFIIFFFFKIGYNWNQLDTIDIWIYVVTQDVFEVLGSRQLRII